MVVGIILAAGQSTRMGPVNKLTKQWQGKPLVRHVFDAASDSQLDEVLVVTGHEQEEIHQLLPEAAFVQNARFETGMGSSIKCGVTAAGDADGVLILLGDMPLVSSAHINAMLDAFSGDPDAIVVAVNQGKLGNPVLFSRIHFGTLSELVGDRGARKLIEQTASVTKIEIGEAAGRDFDTPERFTTSL